MMRNAITHHLMNNTQPVTTPWQTPFHRYQFDAGPSSKCPERGEGSQVSRRAHVGQHKELQALS